jgi:hypothetical protein
MTIFVQPVGGGTPTGVAGVYDYFSLKQAVQDWLVRSDLAGYIDYFIQMAEQQIYRDIFTMNQGRGVQALEASLSVTIANGVAPLPTGYLGLRHALVSLAGNTYELQRRNAEFIYTQFPNRQSGSAPSYIAREGQNFIFGPYPDSNYTITGVYWQKTAQLTSVNNVTWMTNDIPIALLAACNVAAAIFNDDDARLQKWTAIYQSQMQGFLMADRAEEQSGSAFAMVAA